jgi:hypothetical protein
MRTVRASLRAVLFAIDASFFALPCALLVMTIVATAWQERWI